MDMPGGIWPVNKAFFQYLIMIWHSFVKKIFNFFSFCFLEYMEAYHSHLMFFLSK